MPGLNDYAAAFARLNTASDRTFFPATTFGRAPYKPLLLLTVIDLFAEGHIVGGRVFADPELGELFLRYCHRILSPESRPNLALPFFHLKNDGGFWQLVATPGNERPLRAVSQIQGMAQLARLVAYAQLDRDLIACLSVSEGREVLRNVLVTTYFSREAQAVLETQGIVNLEAYRYSRTLLTGRVVAEVQVANEYLPEVRNQGFRRAVVSAYDYRCATCGIKIVTFDGHTVIEAAHIRPWSDWHDDRPTNGMALCRLCHWCFDEGLMGVDQSRAILLSRQLTGEPNVPAHLATLAKRPIVGPIEERLAPDLEALQWHQRNVFRVG